MIEYFDLILENIKNKSSDRLSFLCFSSKVLKNGNFRQRIHKFFEEKHPEYFSFTRGGKDILIVAKKNSEFSKFIFNFEINSLNEILCIILNRKLFEEIKNFTKEEIEKEIIEKNLKKDENNEKNKNKNNINNENNNNYFENMEISNFSEIKDNEKSENSADITHKKRKRSDPSEEEKIFFPYLPKINQIEILESYCDSVLIKVPFISKQDLIMKNNSYFKGFRALFKEAEFSYIILILENKTNKFIVKNEIKIPVNIFEEVRMQEKNNLLKYYNLKIDNLQENKVYFIEIILKFGEFYSKNSPIFTIRTSYSCNPLNKIEEIKSDNFHNEISNKITKLDGIFSLPNKISCKREYYSLGKSYNNCLFVNSKNFDEIDLEKRNLFDTIKNMNNSNQNENPFYLEIPLFLKLKYDEISDFSTSQDATYILNYNSEIITSGKFYCKNIPKSNIKNSETNNLPNKHNENIDFDFDYDNNENISVDYSDNPFTLKLNTNLLNKIPLIKLALSDNILLALDCAGSIYSSGNNKYGQLGRYMEYTHFSNKLNKINFNCNNSGNDNIFMIDIEANEYTCLSIGIVNGKQRLFQWGLGEGMDKEDINKIFSKLDFSIKPEIKKSNIPILLKSEDIGSVIKIKSKYSISFLISQKKLTDNTTINICHSLGFCILINFVKENIHPDLLENFRYLSKNIEFFENNNLSVLDIGIGPYNCIFLVKNLIKNTNEIYGYGQNSNGQLGNLEIENISDSPVLIDLEEIKNPIKLELGMKYSVVLCEKDGKKILYRIGLEEEIFYNKKLLDSINNKNELVKEIKREGFEEKEILKIDCIGDNISLLVKNIGNLCELS